jgi:ribosomal peptide maturation radical SAM protein 1
LQVAAPDSDASGAADAVVPVSDQLLRERPAGLDVAFVVMPFADIQTPAIGVSLLQAQLVARGRSSRVFYFNIRFAELIGEPLYRRLSDGLSANALVGEWFFADCAFGNTIPPEYEYVSRVLSRSATPDLVADIIEARRFRHSFINQCAADISEVQPRIVGFTTAFDQTCACLAVAKTIKSWVDPPVVVFGGANCEGGMGRQLLASVDWIDNVCTGEGDEAFPAFVDEVIQGNCAAAIPGMPGQRTSSVADPPMIRNLNALPAPNYRDYLERVRASPLGKSLQPRLLFQSSRGCWWGEKQHCTFCGLNGQGMAYRSKSADAVFEELETLVTTYGVKQLSSVDNILDVRHIAALFPRLRDSGLGVELFYEVKANLRFDQLAVLKAGGVTAIQPGLESLSNQVLRLMKKGCTALQNIQLLRWCKELGMTVAWNILSGFPGESAEAYEAMAALMPLLMHLPAPVACAPIRLDRFSPLFTQCAQLGLSRVRPKPAYYYVFPFGRLELERIAYFFDFDYSDGRHPEEYTAALHRAVASWWRAALQPDEQQPHLDATWISRDEVVIRDTRDCATKPSTRYFGMEARVLAACDQARSLSGVARQLGGIATDQAILSCLQDLIDCGHVVEMEGSFLTLAVMRNRSAMIGECVRDDNIGANAAVTPEPLLHSV